MDDLKFMDEALALAREAAAEGEVPVGCVIVKDDEIDPIMQDDEPDLSAVTSGAPRPVREKKKKE